ncbi:MAG: GFA family protein [Kofleriaceae bacterium]
MRVSLCHCLNCQRRSGSAFAIQARFPVERVTIEGAASEYTLTGDEGTRATFRFCGTCGATVYFTNETIADLVAVPVGAFADPTFPQPRTSIYNGRKHPWVTTTGVENCDP